MSLAEKLFGSFSDRELKKINPLTKQVLALEPKYQAMSDPELQAQTPALKEKLAALGFLTRTPRGRCATRLAYEHLALKAPESGSAEDNGQQSLF